MSSWVEVSVSVSVSGCGLSTWMNDELPEERKEAEELVELAERGGEDMKLKLRLWVIGNDNELRGQSYVNCLDSKLCLMIQGRLINRVQGLVDVCGLEFRHIGGLGTYIYAGKKTKFGHEPKYRENMTWKAFTQAESTNKKKQKKKSPTAILASQEYILVDHVYSSLGIGSIAGHGFYMPADACQDILGRCLELVRQGFHQSHECDWNVVVL